MPDLASMLTIWAELLRHRQQLGASIWEYLWLRAHATIAGDGEDEPAMVDHGRPIPTNRIARELGRSREAVLSNLERLEAGNYIVRSGAPGHAYRFRVATRLTAR
jgi:DNA-binding MarR family transcriptional regulator